MRRADEEEEEEKRAAGPMGRGCTCTRHCGRRRRSGPCGSKRLRRRRRRYHNGAAPMAEARAGRGCEEGAQTVLSTILASLLPIILFGNVAKYTLRNQIAAINWKICLGLGSLPAWQQV